MGLLLLLLLILLVGVLPDVAQTDAGVEAVEEHDGQRRVVDDHAGELAKVVVRRVVHLHALQLKGVQYPEGDVEYEGEDDQLTAGLPQANLRAVGAATQPIDDEGRLDHHLRYRQQLNDAEEDVIGALKVLLVRYVGDAGDDGQ